MKIKLIFLVQNVFVLIIFPLMLIGCSKKQEESTLEKNSTSNIEQSNNNIATNSQPEKKDNLSTTKHYKVKVVRTYPHDTSAFTQGLIYHNDFLYESTGLKFFSTIKKMDLEKNKVLKSIKIPGNYFAEGIAIVGNKIYMLTWETNVCLVYDLKTFEQIGSFDYYGEGWGLTFDGNALIMSDGTNNLRFLNPEDFQILRALNVQENNRPIQNLNELEYINGEIWANIWMTNNIIKIDPNNGNVTAWIDLSDLLDYFDKNRKIDVLNGIAFDKKTNRLFVTGKLWPLIFEITLEEVK
ncbi:MAG TPA: glutaminyl-peptide cyclotransferase [Candidatus Kapabacteria bacterium]|nr:glutaminyl-peptide cyclotransferase [Candidatus Kapabacteria bacterium]HPO62451.1 glutaminyl-peptide cyclotransferase [Candidatus Kapabacteria bacterium]